MLDEEHQERITRAIENACMAIEVLADSVKDSTTGLLANEVRQLFRTLEYNAR